MAAKEDKPENGVAVAEGLTQPVAEYIPGKEEWAVPGTDTLAGHDLAKDALLDALVGIPFVITRLTFRRGIPRTDGSFKAVCAVETAIAPEDVLKRRRVNMAEMPFEPGAQVVFNDGSTGVYRQLVAYLATKGYITIPEELPEQGGYGESRYDLAHWEWTRINSGEVSQDKNGNPVYAINVRLTCPRGLRLSEYASDYNPNGSGKTRYLA
jgi:hypothetical protein